MLLTVSTTHRPATDLGYLLHKHPARLQTFDLSFGSAHVFYPEATEDRCTAALLVEVDTIELVRGAGKRGSRSAGAHPARTLDQYVNDRPYAASSFTSVAIAEVFGTAMNGRCADRPETAAAAIPLEATLPVIACRGGEPLARRLFEPLGYTVDAVRLPLDDQFPEWGESRYIRLRLSGRRRLADLLTQLYVLIPVLDDDKHYVVGDDEVEKLLARGAGWLPSHPERELIAQRYLSHRRALTRSALERLLEEDRDEDEAAGAHDAEEREVEERVSLHSQRLGAVMAVLKQSGARRVLDVGCGEGRLLALLAGDRSFTEIAGMDVSWRSLELAARRLRLDRLAPAQRNRITLFQGSLTYRDARLAGYEAAAAVEVVEHLDPSRLAAFERCLFGAAQPGTVVLTTPNIEYNVRFDTLPAGRLRHRDHRFEWTRAEFEAWSGEVAAGFGYAVRFLPIGPVDDEVGPASQMAVFTR